MADKVVLKMFSYSLLFIFISNVSFSLAEFDDEEPCSCSNVCYKNYTVNSVIDITSVSACQRGCRFYLLDFHILKNHKSKQLGFLGNVNESCINSCTESYSNEKQFAACKFGCCIIKLSEYLCSPYDFITSQFSYSFKTEEPDFFIHPGEPELDDALTDPGLRKQIQKTAVEILDATPKIPEIRFKNLPVKTEKLPELSHSSFRCPKFYGLDSKFEFRNGKIIIGDLYLFVGVFIFVVLCFLLGHHLETRNIKKQLMESRFSQKNDFADKERLLKMDFHEYDLGEKERPPEYSPSKSEIPDSAEALPKKFDTKIEAITLVFNEEDVVMDKPVYNYFKI